MKTIIYILLFLIISSIVLPSVPWVMHRNDTTVFLESKASKYDSALLINSARIIDYRLQSINIEDYKIALVKERPGIQIEFGSDDDYNKSKELLIHKGDLKFVQVIKRDEALKTIHDLNVSDDLIFNSPLSEEQEIVIGKYKMEEQKSINLFIEKHKQLFLNNGFLLAWSDKPLEKGNRSLYALNLSSVLDINEYVKSAKTQNPEDNGNEVFVELTKIGGEKLKTYTHENLNKNVAIVLDDQVYFAPMVKQTIFHGKFIISGQFSDAESMLLKTIILSGEIPLEFNFFDH